MGGSETLFERLWRRHVVRDEGDGFALIHVDRHVVVDMNGRSFPAMARRGLSVRNPELTFATADHSIATDPRADDPAQADSMQLRELREGTERYGIRLFDIGMRGHGIVHVIAPELGLVLPGMSVVVGDSHTTTNGALGTLAWGVGQGELLHILATQTTRLRKPRTMRISLEGVLPPGIGAKDVILHVIGKLGVRGGSGLAVEFAGSAVRAMPMEARFTLCNMTTEFGARFGMIAPDEICFSYCADRPFAPSGAAWDAAVRDWRTLPGDLDARFDREVTIEVDALVPQITWGNSIDAVEPVDGRVPDPMRESDPARRNAMKGWLDYMGLQPGEPLAGLHVDHVFIGSCTNGRISDLREAAGILRGRKIAEHVTAWVVPGSDAVRAQAEAEGLDRIFKEAGFDWRLPGCSMCLGMNGETVPSGHRSIATSNRNFAGRQGPGSRTHLASPALAAASACAGVITDPRTFLA